MPGAAASVEKYFEVGGLKVCLGSPTGCGVPEVLCWLFHTPHQPLGALKGFPHFCLSFYSKGERSKYH